MDRYLVEPLAKWIVHSTGWTTARATTVIRSVIVAVVLLASLFVYVLFE